MTTVQESRDVLDKDDAAMIPAERPGVGYLRSLTGVQGPLQVSTKLMFLGTRTSHRAKAASLRPQFAQRDVALESCPMPDAPAV